ncbi:MAG: hypothetical protein EZS28_029928, partial [Streblomastix strix]
PNDNDDDESVNREPGLQVHGQAIILFDDFVNAMNVESDKDEDYAAYLIQQSSDDDHQSIYSASGDEEIRNAQWLPRFRTSLEADGDANSLTKRENKAEAVHGIKRRRLLEDESEDNKEKSDSGSISPQDTETKQQLKKLAPVLGKGERHNKKAAIRLLKRDLFKLADSKEEAAKRVLGMFELVNQATGQAQQLRKQNINFRSNQFSYNWSPVQAALSPKDIKAWKENKSISMNTSRSLSRKGGSSRSPSTRGRSFQRGRRSKGSDNSYK